MGRQKTKPRKTQKIGKERGNSYQKNEEIYRQKAHTNTWKLSLNVSTIIDIFLDQKRVNVCEDTVKTAPRRVFTHIYSLQIEKDICDHRNVSVKLPCVCVCLSSGYLFIFSVKVFSFIYCF